MYKNLDDYINRNINKSIKLHLGCGSKYWEEWCNIDANPSEESDTHRGKMEKTPDLWADITNLTTSEENVDVICSHHVMEHFYRYQVIDMFENFFKILKPGGIIITEMPNLRGVLTLLFWIPIKPNYQEKYKNRDIIKSQLYGASWERNPKGYPYHKYIWEKKEFCSVLKEIGFDVILSTGATKSHMPFRDMAVICQKPNINKNLSNKIALFWKKKYGSKIFRLSIQINSILRILLISFNLKFLIKINSIIKIISQFFK